MSAGCAVAFTDAAPIVTVLDVFLVGELPLPKFAHRAFTFPNAFLAIAAQSFAPPHMHDSRVMARSAFS